MESWEELTPNYDTEAGFGGLLEKRFPQKVGSFPSSQIPGESCFRVISGPL